MKRYCFAIILSLLSSQAFALSCNSSAIETKVFTATSPGGQNIENFEISVPSDYVVVGGGLDAGFNKKYIYASYPKPDLSAWIISAKDQVYANYDSVTGYAIGMKVTGLTAAQLKSHITINQQNSGQYPYPNQYRGGAAFAEAIGGGFDINWTGWGILAYRSFPESSGWRSTGKVAGNYEFGDLTNYTISINGLYISQIGGSFKRFINQNESAPGQHIQSTAPVTGSTKLVGCGARVTWNRPTCAGCADIDGPGHNLWKIKPTVSGTTPTGCEAGSKDLLYADGDETIISYAMGLSICN